MQHFIADTIQALNAMPPKERDAAETQMLADYARHAAFTRPIGTAGLSSIFRVSPGLEEAALAEDTDVVSITTQDELQQAMEQRDKPLLLVRSQANCSQALIEYMLERSLHIKTVFVAR